MIWLNKVKDFFYEKNKIDKIAVKAESKPAIKPIYNNEPLRLNSFGLPTLQNLFLIEVFLYTMDSITTKEKQLTSVIKDLKTDRVKNAESIFELTEQLKKIKSIMRTSQGSFIIKAENLNIAGIRKSVNNIYFKDILYSDLINTINDEWLNSNEKYNKITKEILDEMKLKILQDIRDAGVEDIDYSGLNKKDDPPSAVGKIDFKKIKL